MDRELQSAHGVRPYRPRYWVSFSPDPREHVIAPQPLIVALEPEVRGTWRVRVQFQGEDVYLTNGMEYPEALESLLAAFEWMNQEKPQRLHA